MAQPGPRPRFSFVDEGVGRSARGIQLCGHATLTDAAIRLSPRRVVTWGIVTDPMSTTRAICEVVE